MTNDATNEAQGAAAPIDRRSASLLLSGLVLTPDGSLEVFRERRAADPKLSIDRLRHAREILEQVSLAITSLDPARWERVDQAWSALCEPPDAEHPPTPAATPSGSSRAEGPSPPAPEPRAAGWSHGALGGRSAPEPIVERAPAVVVPAARVEPSAVAASPFAAGPPPVTPARPPMVGLPSPATGAPPAPMPDSPWAARGRAALSEPPPTPAPLDAPGSPSPPVPEPRPPDAAPMAAMRARTSDFPAAQLEPGSQSTGLPFRRNDAKPPPPVTATATSRKAPGSVALGETAEVGMLSPLARMSLPFRRAASAPPPTEGASSGGPAPIAAQPAPSPASAVLSPAAMPSEPLAAHLSAITLDHYAAIRAQCDAMPQWTAQIRGRYHIQSEDEWRLLDQHWQSRLGSEPALAESYRRQYAQVEKWLTEQRKT